MFRLQKLQMPKSEICNVESMYYRTDNHNKECDDIYYDFSVGQYKLNKDQSITTNTYFNSFSFVKWKKYTTIRKIFVCLNLKGRFEISLMRSFLVDGKKIDSAVKQIHFTSDNLSECRFFYDCSLEQFDCIYFIKINALEDDCIFVSVKSSGS